MQLLRHRANAKRSTEESSSIETETRPAGRRMGSLLGSPNRKASAVAGAVIAIAIAPVALAAGSHSGDRAHAAASGRSALRGEIHNPPHSSFSRTTGLFANTKGWVTRTKNLGSGGSAQVLCAAPAAGSPCLEAGNSSTGLAFSFSSAGATGGTILLKNAAGAPFTTNAHGVASGLNANYLEGKQAKEFLPFNGTAVDSSKLGGQEPSHYLNVGEVLFAVVSPEPKIQSTRGAKSVTKKESTYTVVFEGDVSKCSYTASPQGEALSEGQIGVAPTSGNANGVDVIVPATFKGGFDLQVDC